MLKKVTPAPDNALAHEPRLYRIVAGRIEELIREQGIGAGERLPPEREMASRLAVSRASLREALIALELRGVVDVRGGSGVYVSRVELPRHELDEAGPGPFEVLAARRLVEAEVCASAARMASDSAIEAIRSAVVEMERQHDNYSSNEKLDRDFHLSIARATGNSAMVGAVDHLWKQRGRLWHKLKEHFQTEELRQATLLDHRRILDAIVAHDPAEAHAAMRAHLERVTRTFSRG
ncbi:FadR/GntR family transcriptional regulator [Massilia sp. CCM 8734]|uniref:FadR/GntR family transcriptional regulator n=1 Tax=Massilia sp. CCM 8734 TaxID=2609283 RepID=UPI0014226C88|nr:FadR/GntR family transcriptional regulator [Massilia sp. CCM 8734]NHZ96248.1 FCD domain-containing protein [Massilia sp. CCM 8734]